MNYVVFDLEWNQPSDGKTSRERDLLFEIIEIGAVKLDSEGNKIAEFSETIKPQVYNKLNFHIQKMLGIRMSDLKHSPTFPIVAKRFLKWCGDDVIFCTWGSQDLTELQRNISYYDMKPMSDGPIMFYNLQKIYADHIGGEAQAYNLESAVDNLGITKDIPFHRAYADAYYTAKIMAMMNKDCFYKGRSFDLYHLPRSEKEEIYDVIDSESLFVSKGYTDRSEITGNRKLMAMTCAKCKKRSLRPKVRWFSSNSKLYYGAAVCMVHGPIKCRLKLKHSDQGLVYIEKTMTYGTYDDIEEIKSRKKRLKEKTAKIAAEKKMAEYKES